MAITRIASDARYRVASIVCIVLGVVFLIIGVWGFITQTHVLGLFHVNPMHNIVHLISGALALWVGLTSEYASRLFCWIFGAVYGLVALLGFAGFDPVVNLLNLNMADNWLHLVLCLAFLAAAAVSEAEYRRVLPRRAAEPGSPMHPAH